MFFPRSTERYDKKQKRKTPRFESLEPRDLLAGDFSNSLVDQTQMNRILSGLDDVADWSTDLGQSDAFASPLSLVVEADGSQLSLGELVDLGETFDAMLATPLRTYLESIPVANRDTDAIVQFVSTLPGVVAAEGGLTTSTVDELRFEVEFREDFSIGNLGLDLGAESDALDMSFDTELDAQLTTAATFSVNFGVLLTPNLSDEQAFFLRDSSIQIETDMNSSAETA